VVSAYQAARGASRAKATLAIAVAAEVDVEVDGDPLGRGPRSVEIAAGEHVVVARAGGRRASGQVVLVPAAGVRVELPLEVDPFAKALGGAAPAGEAPGGPLAIGAGERAVAQVVDAAGVLADLDELWLVVVSWRGGQPTLLGQRCALVPLACTPVREVRFASIARLGAAARQLTRDLVPRVEPGAALGPIVFEDTRATEPELPRHAGGRAVGAGGRPWWKNGWLWAGVGAVAVAAGTTVWLLSDSGPGDVTWTLPPLRNP
jgi:hypothetical protein